MRLIGAFLCFFLFVIISVTISYIYLMWTNYWIRVQTLERRYALEKERSKSGRVMHRRLDSGGGDISFKLRMPKDNENQGESGELERKISLDELPQDKLMAHLNTYKEQITQQLKNTVMETGKQVQSDTFPNAYNVSYRGAMFKPSPAHLNPRQALCSAKKRVRVRTFTRGNPTFRKLKLDQFFLPVQFLAGRQFNTCAVVSSAGSLHGSKLGAFIDSHDVVVRFNNAPTENNWEDVGNKTSIRIVNSQVVAKPHFKFLESKKYSKTSVLVWDPSAYKASVEEWYNKPDWPFFEQFFSKRLMQPEDDLHLLEPGSLWSIWNWLQSMTAWPILPTPPSSGFLGIMLMLDHCATLHVMEYIPSMRLTKRCHYYDEEENLGCTLGDWHPLSAEKLVAMMLHTGTDKDMFQNGVLTIPGFATCNLKPTTT